MGFKIDSVIRMKKDKANPYDMVAVTSERSDAEKKLLDVRRLRGFRVKVESNRKPATLQQCFKCQQFGHVQFRFTGKEVCAFCSQEHPSKECKEPRSRGDNAKCRNCGGDHPAFYRRCPKHPVQVARKAEEVRIRKVKESEVKTGISFSDRVKGKAAEKVEKQVVRKAVDSLDGKIKEILKRLLPRIIRTLNR